MNTLIFRGLLSFDDLKGHCVNFARYTNDLQCSAVLLMSYWWILYDYVSILITVWDDICYVSVCHVLSDPVLCCFPATQWGHFNNSVGQASESPALCGVLPARQRPASGSRPLPLCHSVSQGLWCLKLRWAHRQRYIWCICFCFCCSICAKMPLVVFF